MNANSEQQAHDPRRRYSKADKNEQYRVLGPSKLIYTEGNQLYAVVEKNKKSFKSVQNRHPINKDYIIIDFSLNTRGPQEDQIYVRYPFYRNNIRRGNTLLVHSVNKQTEIARRGLMKFFDISQSSLRAIKDGNIKEINKKSLQNHRTVFEEIQTVLSLNKNVPEGARAKVHVYRLNKANGQNAQVSFNKTLDEWMIASKNVSIFVRDSKDIELYTGQRYSFAKLMAEAWFSILQKKSQEEISQLKRCLMGRTIVGEYCGNPEFQHLVKYQQITIYFYAIVQFDLPYSCIPPNQAIKIFQKYSIPIVKNYQNSYVGHYDKFEQLGSRMLQIFREVSTASIFDEEEGSVVYFVIEKPREYCRMVVENKLEDKVGLPQKWQQSDGVFHVSSLGKLKTLEYRILRKLREKLKSLTAVRKGEQNSNKKFQQKYASFERQVFGLVKNQKLNKPLEYYFCAALLAMQYAFKHNQSPECTGIIGDYYLDFISVIFWCMEHKKPVTSELVLDQELHLKLREQIWDKYGVEVVEQYPQMLDRIVPKYAKIKESMKVEPQEEEEVESDN